jgi:hypothetical protein
VYHKQILEEQTALGYIVLQKGKSEAWTFVDHESAHFMLATRGTWTLPNCANPFLLPSREYHSFLFLHVTVYY